MYVIVCLSVVAHVGLGLMSSAYFGSISKYFVCFIIIMIFMFFGHDISTLFYRGGFLFDARDLAR